MFQYPLFDAFLIDIQEMLDNTYASPFVQCVLRAASGDDQSLLRLIPLILGAKPQEGAEDGDRLEGAKRVC